MNRAVCLAVAAVVLAVSSAGSAQTSLKGSELALQSDGTPDGKLERNGYVGTYIRVDKAGDVEIVVKASGTVNNGARPRLTVAVADDAVSTDLDANANARLKTRLPAGTHFLRVQLDNAPLPGARAASIESIDVSGATFLNENSDAHALAAADSYIDGFRKGEVVLQVKGVPAGTPVRVKLKRHSFHFGAAVSGYEQSMHLEPNPAPGSDSARYQQALREQFSLIVPGNAGKWEYNEKERGKPTMEYIDQIRAFAKTNRQNMRMHAILWDTGQQPQFVKDLLTKAAAGDAAAKADLRKAISDRIQYYVRERATSYLEIDVLNESFHQPRYLNIFGVEGIAEIFKESADAVKAAGAQSRLAVNEFNLFQWSQVPPYGPDAKGAFEPYANWYREHVEQLIAAGGPVTAIGVQYYVDVRPEIPQPHSAARMNQVLQNLSISGLPISLTEFGVNALPQQPAATPQQSAAAAEAGGKAIDEAMRINFGTPSVTTFILWGFWRGDVWDQAPLGVLYDRDWSLTPAGKAHQALMKKWDTDVTLPVGADGTVRLHGFYGDYEVTAGDKKGSVTLTREAKSASVDLEAR